MVGGYRRTEYQSPRFLSSLATESSAGNDGLIGAGNLGFLVLGVMERLVSADESELHPSDEDTIEAFLDSDSPLRASFDGMEGNADADVCCWNRSTGTGDMRTYLGEIIEC